MLSLNGDGGSGDGGEEPDSEYVWEESNRRRVSMVMREGLQVSVVGGK